MKGLGPFLFFVILGVFILGMLGYIFLKSPNHSINVSTNSNSQATPTVVVKDFAPSLQMSQKTAILIQQSDSSEVKYLVPTSQVDTYVKSLPEGDHVISKSP